MLTVQQRLFVEEYVSNGFKGAEACRQAGYSSKNNAYYSKKANRLLKEPEIKEYLEEKLKEIKDDKIIKAEELLNYLSECIRGNVYDEHIVNLKTSVTTKKVPIKHVDRLKATKLMFDYYNLLNGNESKNNAKKPIAIINDIQENNFEDVGITELENEELKEAKN